MKKDQNLRSRSWVMVAPADRYSREELLKELGAYAGARAIGQLEEGNVNGYRHWQLYTEFKAAVRFSALQKRLPGVHLEVRKASREEAVAYALKETTRAVGEARFILGEWEEELLGSVAVKAVKIKERAKEGLDRMRQLILDGMNADQVIVQERDAWRYGRELKELEQSVKAVKAQRFKKEFRNVESFYLSGPARVGKTYHVLKDAERRGKSVYRVSNWTNPFDSYDGEQILILDEFRSSLPLDVALNLMDPYPMFLPARYADPVAQFEEVWVVSNYLLGEQYPDVRIGNFASWEAFIKRFKAVYRMEERGVLELEESAIKELVGA